MFRKLTIKSIDNQDLNGVFRKNEIEVEMQELGYELDTKDYSRWVEWVLDHVFDCELPSSIVDMILNTDVKSITFYIEDDLVTVTKD